MLYRMVTPAGFLNTLSDDEKKAELAATLSSVLGHAISVDSYVITAVSPERATSIGMDGVELIAIDVQYSRLALAA